MAGNQIGNEVLFLAEFLIDSFIFFTKRIVDIASRLAHDGEHLRADVLRRDFELAADVILTQLAEKRVGFVGHDVVITQTGTHKHFFNLGQGAHLAKQLDVIRVIDDHIRAGLGEQALAACARADFELLIAGGAAEIGRRAAHIMDVPLKFGICVMAFASSITDSWLRVVTMRPCRNVMAQKEHEPKQPRVCAMENCTSSMAGTPPNAS